MTRRNGWTALSAVAILACAGSVARAAEVSAGADMLSAYVWRGIVLNDTPVFQPWLDVSEIGIARGVSLGVNVWTNVNIGDGAGAGLIADGALDSGEIAEIDLMATLTLPRGFKLGLAQFTFPTTRPEQQAEIRSTEIFAAWSGVFIVKPTINAVYDLDDNEDYYVSLALGKELELGEKTTLGFEALAAIAGEDFTRTYGGTNGGLYNYGLTAKLSNKVTEKITIGATLGYTGSFNKARLPKQDASLYGGVNITIGL